MGCVAMMRTAVLILLCACAANAALFQRMGLRRFSSGSASSYGSAYQSGYTSGGAGTGGSSTTSGGVDTATAITLTQTFKLNIAPSTYTAGSDVKKTTEVTMLKIYDIFDATKAARNYAKDGCSVSSSAARRSATITVTTKVTPALRASAEAGAVAFKNDPTVSDVSGVTVTNPPGSTSGAASTSASMFALIAA